MHSGVLGRDKVCPPEHSGVLGRDKVCSSMHSGVLGRDKVPPLVYSGVLGRDRVFPPVHSGVLCITMFRWREVGCELCVSYRPELPQADTLCIFWGLHLLVGYGSQSLYRQGVTGTGHRSRCLAG